MKALARTGVGIAGLMIAAAAGATTYTSDTTLSDFTSQVGSYATLSNFSAGDVSSPYTPTTADVNAGKRVYAGNAIAGLPVNNWILATFGQAQSSILVFPNEDHFGAPYDGFQYTIEGSNDGSTWTPLFDATSVLGGVEPFTLGTFTGTAPTWVNNVPAGGGPVDYIAQFDFGQSFTQFAFGASTVAFAQGNTDQELTAVASLAAGVPEPATLALLGLSIAGLGLTRRRRTR